MGDNKTPRKDWIWALVILGAALMIGITIYAVRINADKAASSGGGTDSKYENVNNSSHSYGTNSTEQKASDICKWPYCKAKKMDGGQYCASHTCHYPGCRNRKQDKNMYCTVHEGTKPKPSGNGTNSGGNKDPYDTGSYTDPDDFYEDYFYEFEDYDEAEQYWDENH